MKWSATKYVCEHITCHDSSFTSHPFNPQQSTPHTITETPATACTFCWQAGSMASYSLLAMAMFSGPCNVQVTDAVVSIMVVLLLNNDMEYTVQCIDCWVQWPQYWIKILFDALNDYHSCPSLAVPIFHHLWPLVVFMCCCYLSGIHIFLVYKRNPLEICPDQVPMSKRK